MLPFVAIWDTGATHSVITQAVVDACGLVPTGMAKVGHVDGFTQAETYLVNIGLPQNVIFYGARVTKGKLTGEANILIGMNIISQGDFAVTNFNKLTKFSFRVPSMRHIDFIEEETRRPQFQHGGRPKPKRPKPPNPLGRGRRRKKNKEKRKR